MVNQLLAQAIAEARSAGAGTSSGGTRGTGTPQHCKVASDLDTVIDAWRLVYTIYRRAGLIPANSCRLHTVVQAVGKRTAVVFSHSGASLASTLTAVTDGGALGKGLPAADAYRDELADLRNQGRRLMEVCLIADRRRHFVRVHESILELMRHAFYFALHMDVSDVLIEVDPDYCGVYRRLFGFEPFGPVRPFPAMNGRFATLMRLDLDAHLAKRPLHPVITGYLGCELAAKVFENRFAFDPGEVADTVLGQYLRDRQDPGPKPAA
ncbi:MAG: hypothetical protein V3U29_09045 [Phycisphaeraceae bacterium]